MYIYIYSLYFGALTRYGILYCVCLATKFLRAQNLLKQRLHDGSTRN